MNRVLDQLPALYRGIKEFEALSEAQSRQLDLLDTALMQIEDDQFILTSSEPAIYRREKEFNILPDRTIESLDFRKRRLLARMQSNPPYTMRYLKEMLANLVGNKNTELKINTVLFELEVLIHVEDSSFYLEVKRLLERVVPLNINMTVALLVDSLTAFINTKEYTFPVPYRTTGTFHTDPVGGIASKASVEAESKIYTNQVPYPITGTFYCTEGGY